MRKVVLMMIALMFAGATFGQLSGSYIIPLDYPTIDAAITALNNQGVAGSGVTFNVAAGHIDSTTSASILTTSGRAEGYIIFQKIGTGDNPKIVRKDAGSLTTSILGGQGDAVMIFQGADYVTFDGIDITTINSGIEYGYMFRKIDGNDACKFINIKNCKITMTKGTGAYVTGIYVSNLDAASLVSQNTGILVQSTAGRNENITITGNTIENMVTGINLRGFNDAAAPWAFYDQNITVGGSTGNGNIFRNYGGGSTNTAYGIYSQYNTNLNISYNTFDNAAGGGTNATGTLYGIYNPSSGALSGGNVYFNNNIFQLGMSSASAMYPIYNVQSCNSVEISSNTFGFSNTFASTTVYLIYNSNATTNNTISYNSTTGTISKTGSGTFYGYYNLGSPVNGTSVIQNNNFSNITLTGTSGFYGIYSGTSATHTQEIYSNIVSNVTAGSGTTYGIYCTYGLLNNVYLNQINTIAGGAIVYGLSVGNSSTVTSNVYDNTIHSLSTTGSSSAIYGFYSAGAATLNFNNNRIFNITAGGTTGNAHGITATAGTTRNFYNNYVSDIKAPNSSGANVVTGFNLTGGTTANVMYNTVFLNAVGSGATFGSSAVYAASTVGLDLRNNILVNKSTRNGNTGFTVGIRRNAVFNPTYYLAGSNTNDLYVTVANWNYLFFDGQTGTAGRDSTIDMFKTRVAPMDAGSFSEDPPFVDVTTTPYNLHLQTILTKCESGATPVSAPVAINTDFDGDPRFPNPGYPENLSYPATAPDVGADEFAGQPSFTCVQPNPGNTLSTFNNICWGKTITLSLETPPVGTGNTYQWQTSSDGAVYSDISGANASTYSITPVTHAWYRCYIVCQNGDLTAYSNPIHIVFANEISETNSPVERCGVGSVNLEAVASGGTITWYTSQTGGEPIGTGSPFLSPPITGNTTFWVGADDIAPQETVGRSAPAVTTGTTLSNYGLVFNALSDITINTVDVYPVSTAGNMNVAVYNSSQVLVAGPLAIPFPTGNGATAFTATLNLAVPAGTGYRLVITSMSGGNLVRESSSISYPYSSSNVSITHGATSLTGTTSTSYYWFYNIKATGGCMSPRVPVVADVVSPPDIMVSNDVTVCNDIISELTVISNPSLFDLYVWSPVTHLFTDPDCTIPYTGTNSMTVYVRTNIADEYHYTCTGTNTVTQCANSDEVVVAILPENPEITSVPDSLCQGGIATMTVNFPSSYGDATFQWQESTDGLSFSDIDGATNLTYTTPFLGFTTYYQIIIRNGEGEYCAVPLYTMVVSNPVITSTTPGFHCGPGVVQLEATGTTSTLKWYDSPNGGVAVGTGSPFTTPYLWESKTYYVSAIEQGTILEAGGKLTPSGTAGAMSNFYGMVFNTNDYIKLQTVDVYPTSTAGQCGISLYNSSQQLLAGPFYFSFPAGDGTVPYTIPLNLDIPQGTGYRLLITAMLGGNLKYESSGVTYPINNGTLLSMTAAATSLTGTSTSTYRWFYNWRVMKGCASPLIPVLATINLAPFYELTPSQAICFNETATITVTNGTSYYDTFTWSPADNLYTDPACTVPYVLGTVATTVYMKSSTPGTYTVQGSAFNTVNECTSFQETSVTILPETVEITSDPDSLCVSGDADLTLLPAMNYGAAKFQWQISTDGTTFNDISGATTSTYNTGTITSTTHYRVIIINSALNTCLMDSYTLYVDSPAVLSTTPATRCGEGTVDLGATGTPGSTLTWYGSALGGSPLGTGTVFTTPVISSTTSFYVSATSENGGGIGSVGPFDNTFASGSATTSSYYVSFNVEATAMTLIGLYVYPSAAGDVKFNIANSAGTVLTQITYPVTTSDVNVKTYIPVNFPMSAGSAYRISQTSGCVSLFRNTTGASYPYTLPGVISITGNSFGAAYYYYFYDWQVSTKCSSPLTEVVATVIPSNPVSITASRTICINEVHELTVTSALSDYDTYTWSPAVDIYTDMACTQPYIGGTNLSTVYFKKPAGGVTTYTCNAYNSVNGCNTDAETTVSVIPEAVIQSSPEEICVSGSALLTLEPSTGYGLATFQWQNSPDNMVFSDITGATNQTYQTPTLTATAYYRVQIRNSFGVLCTEPTMTVMVNSPQLLSTTGAERCGPGTVTLSATSSPGTSINWYDVSTGGSPVGTGTSFTTPVLTSTTSYYATASSGGYTAFVGRTGIESTASGTGGGTSSYLTFHADTDFTLVSVDVFPYGTGPGTVTIALRTGDGSTVLNTATVDVVGTQSVTSPAQRVTLNFPITGGADYRLGLINYTGSVTNMYRDYTGSTSVFFPYPYTLPGVMSITGSYLGNYYYYFYYNWQVSTGCESARQEVLASVFPAPPLSITGSKSICVNEIYQLSVTSELTNFDVYTWSPVTDLYTDAACTVPYVENTNASTVYVKAAAGTTTSYTCSSLNNTTLCTNFASTIITVIPQAGITSLPEAICFSGSATLSLTPEGGYGLATFQWQDSPDNVTFTDISGATTQTFTTPSISATRYYKAVIKNEAGAVCSEPVYTMTVNNPILVSTTPGTRCGVGTVDLSATATGGDVQWFASASGGLPLGTGNNFTTPVISATTDFYAQALAPGSMTNNVGMVNSENGTSGSGATTYGLYFDALTSFTLNSVKVYPNATSNGAAGTVTISVINGAGTVLHQAVVDVVGYIQSSNPTSQVVPLNFTISPATGLRLVMTAKSSNISGLMFQPSAQGPYPYPYTLPGVVSITSGTYGGTVYPSLYYYFYNWSVSVGCSSARTAVTATVTAPPAITASATPASVCAASPAVIDVTSPNPDYTFNWMPGNLSGATQTVNPEVTTQYTVTASDALTGCVNVANVTVATLPTPSVMTVTPSTALINEGDIQSLTASGGTLSGTMTFGTSTTTNSTTGYPAPHSNYYGGTKHQMIIRANELIAAGLFAGAPIQSVTFTVTAVGSTFSGTLNNFQIDMGHTTATVLTSSAFLGGLTNVYPAQSVAVAVGTITHVFSTPFVWNGTDNVVIQTSYSNANAGTSTDFVQMTNSDPGFVSTNWYRVDSQSATYVLAATTPSGSGNARPNMVFTFASPTTLAWTPTTDLYSDAAATIPYAGENIAVVYAKPYAPTTYTVTSTATLTSCTRNASAFIDVLPLCQPPVGVNVTNITATGATLGWTEPTLIPTNGYEYEIRTSGAPGSGATGLAASGAVAAGITSANVTGLTSLTDYHAYVRSNCGDGVYSLWTADVPFTTLQGIPENLTVSGVIAPPTDTCFNATNTITVGGNPPTFTILNGGSATFIAGQKITYLPGTVVEAGGYMHGYITLDNTYCGGVIPPIVAVVTGNPESPAGYDFVGFSLYPNPTSGDFTIVQNQGKIRGEVKIEIFSVKGEKVLTEKMIGEKQHLFRFSEMQSGLYFVKIMSDDYIETIKLVKTR